MPIKGLVQDVRFVLGVLADDIALGPPVHSIIFYVVGIIVLLPQINLLDGLRLGGRSISCSFEIFIL